MLGNKQDLQTHFGSNSLDLDISGLLQLEILH
jgi:hypothetical protein